MKYRDLISKSVSELYDNLYHLKKELLNFRIQKSTGSLTNISQIRKNRREVARIKTRLNQMANKK